MIRDSNLDYQWKKEYLPWTQFSGTLKLEAGTPNKLISTKATADAPEVAVVGSTGINAVVMNPGGTGEVVETIWVPSSEIDWEHDVHLRVAYSTDQTTADSVVWKIHYEKLTAPAAIPATVDDALDTVIASDSASTTANAFQYSPVGQINALTVTTNDADTLLALQVELDNYGGSNGAVSFHGVHVAYVPRLTQRHANNEPPIDAANPFTSSI